MKPAKATFVVLCLCVSVGTATWAWWRANESRQLHLRALTDARTRIAELESADAVQQAAETEKLRRASASGALAAAAFELALARESSPAARIALFDELFKAHGLDLSAGDVDQAARSWIARDDVERLAPFVDEWLLACRAAGRIDRAARLEDLLQIVDEDGARRQLREAAKSGDVSLALSVTFDVRHDPRTTRLFGRVVRELGEPAAALTRLREARLARSNDVGLLVELAECLRAAELGVGERAECLAVAAALRPGSARVHSLWAEALLELHEPERALAVSARALDISPSDAIATELLARGLIDAQRTDDALAAYRRAIHFSPTNTDLRSRFGLALRNAGREHEALAIFESNLDLAPDHIPTLRAMAELLTNAVDVSLRNPSRARSLAMRATELGGD